jgi:hypothetical protein
METIAEAKTHLRANFEKGVKCPCCDQLVKLYIRKFNKGMVESLALIFKISLKNGFNWIHVQDAFAEFKLNSNQMDYSQLERWGLIEKKIGKRGDGSNSNGYWKITDKGKEFVLNKIEIDSKVHLYNNKHYGFSGDKIRITSFNTAFNYQELMNEWKQYSGI